jgi:hypothetical protein
LLAAEPPNPTASGRCFDHGSGTCTQQANYHPKQPTGATSHRFELACPSTLACVPCTHGKFRLGQHSREFRVPAQFSRRTTRPCPQKSGPFWPQ